jgi:glycosidase
MVIIQSFDQIGALGLINRSWKGIEAELLDYSKLFSCVWLPPPSSSSGNPGYLPHSLMDFNSYWGTADEFESCVKATRGYGLDVMVDLVLHHAIAKDTKTWYKLDFLNRKAPDDYLSSWQWDNNFGGSFQRTDFSPEQIINNASTTPCITTSPKGIPWVSRSCVPGKSENINCSAVKPMYTVSGDMDTGNLSALNLCDPDILREQFKFLNKLSKIGVNSFRYDQANGFPPSLMQLYNNSDKAKTPAILKRLKLHCEASKMYPQCNDLYNDGWFSSVNPKDFTGPPHKMAVAECFTYSVQRNLHYPSDGSRPWWALEPELKSMNVGLNEADRIGVFDFALHRLMYKSLGFNEQFGAQMPVFFPKVTLDSNYWYAGFDTGVVSDPVRPGEVNIPLVYYDGQKYSKRTPCQVFTFVSNHDNDAMMKLYSYSEEYRGYTDEGFVSYSRMVLAYFMILTMPAVPVVFGLHYYWFKELRALLELRKLLNITYDSQLIIDQRTKVPNRFVWSIVNLEGEKFVCVIVDTVSNDRYTMDQNQLVFEMGLWKSFADPATVFMQVYQV